MSTRVGYAGGSTASPTYRSIGDHTEVFQVDFDPAVISYEQLLVEFWAEHNPCSPTWSTQYKAILFYHDAVQRKAAEESARRVAAERGQEITTELVAAGEFHLAEDYHQKYALRRHGRVLADLRKLYPSESELVSSTAAARVNSYFYGDLTLEQLRVELARLGLRAVGETSLEGLTR